MTLREPGGLVPPIDSADNVNSGDVVGNKLDTEAGDSIAARLVVPLADQANNDWVSDAVGNKLDTVAGDSLIALVKQALVSLVTVDGLHDVPGIDAAADAFIRDVLGRKADTVGGTSVVAILRQILAAVAVVDGYHDVPATDSANNLTMRDAVGSKLDRAYNGGDSIFAAVHALGDHVHSQQRVLPDLAVSTTAAAAVGAWTYGAPSASLGTPADYFDIHWLLAFPNANDEYQGRISVSGTPVAEVAFRRLLPTNRSFDLPVSMPVTAPGPVTIELASAAGSSTCDFKLIYHLY